MLTERERHALRMLEFHTRVEDPRFARRLEQPRLGFAGRLRASLPYVCAIVLVAAVVTAVVSPAAPVGTVAFGTAALAGGGLGLTLWLGRRERRAHRAMRRRRNG